MALSRIKVGGITGNAIKKGLPSRTVSGSAQLASDISGSLGANADVIRSLNRDRISGSLGSNKSLIRKRAKVVFPTPNSPFRKIISPTAAF